MTMKKFITAALAAVLAVSLLAACGASEKARTAAEDKKPAATEKAKPTPSPSAAPSEAPSAKPDSVSDGSEAARSLQTAEEAANDQVTIQNEIDSIKGLLDEGLYDDALMQINALLTKNLTDADKELIDRYKQQISEYMGGGQSENEAADEGSGDSGLID